MSMTLSLKQLLRQARLEPVKGQPQVSVFQIKSPKQFRKPGSRARKGRDQLTADDWKKFEKDINDAFEQIP